MNHFSHTSNFGSQLHHISPFSVLQLLGCLNEIKAIYITKFTNILLKEYLVFLLTCDTTCGFVFKMKH